MGIFVHPENGTSGARTENQKTFRTKNIPFPNQNPWNNRLTHTAYDQVLRLFLLRMESILKMSSAQCSVLLCISSSLCSSKLQSGAAVACAHSSAQE